MEPVAAECSLWHPTVRHKRFVANFASSTKRETYEVVRQVLHSVVNLRLSFQALFYLSRLIYKALHLFFVTLLIFEVKFKRPPGFSVHISFTHRSLLLQVLHLIKIGLNSSYVSLEAGFSAVPVPRDYGLCV